MNRIENVLAEEESSRKKFKSNDNDDNDDEKVSNEEEENFEETTPESDSDFDTEQSKHEQLFGIKARINKDFKRFDAVLKKINSDFIVFEINREGQVARLTSFDLPEKQQVPKEERPASRAVGPPFFRQAESGRLRFRRELDRVVSNHHDQWLRGRFSLGICDRQQNRLSLSQSVLGLGQNTAARLRNQSSCVRQRQSTRRLLGTCEAY